MGSKRFNGDQLDFMESMVRECVNEGLYPSAGTIARKINRTHLNEAECAARKVVVITLLKRAIVKERAWL